METLEGYLAGLASARPTPGGGSAACLSAALGAALVAMVARITGGNPKLSRHHPAAAELADAADELREGLDVARLTDEAAYGAVVEAGTLPKTTDDEKASRVRHMQDALVAAAAAPLETARLSLAVLDLADRALALENQHLASDLGCAVEFAAAGVAAAAFNVRVNHRYLRDPSIVQSQSDALHTIEDRSHELVERVRSAVNAVLAR